MSIVYSCPAKVILSGEHSVVYGKPALVCAVDLRLECIIDPSCKNKSKPKHFRQVEKIVSDYLIKEKILKIKKDYCCAVKSDIPERCNLGSSAAFAVASVAALLDFYSKGRDFSKEIINNLAYKVEKYFHGNPSGVDNTACTFGGLVYFRKEFEFLKTLSLLQFKIPKKIEDRLYLIDSGRPEESTKEMVDFVKDLYGKNPEKTRDIFNNLEILTKRITLSLIKQDISFFEDTVRENQKLLSKLALSSDKTKELIKSLARYGTGKVTGAGGRKKGSGYILFLSKDNSGLENKLNSKKIKYFKFSQDHSGVKKIL